MRTKDAPRLAGLGSAGFSLVEFLIYFAILASVAVLLVNLLITTTRDRGAVQARSEVQQNVRYSIIRMTQAIHAATSINGTPGATLSLAMSDASKNPTVFDVSSNILRITEGTSSAQSLTSDAVKVNSLSFTKISNAAPAKDTVQINITIAYKDNGNTQLQFSKNEITTASLKQ